MIDVSDSQFDRLPIKYVEELIKLSSVIMYRVKNSKFYKQIDWLSFYFYYNNFGTKSLENKHLGIIKDW